MVILCHKFVNRRNGYLIACYADAVLVSTACTYRSDGLASMLIMKREGQGQRVELMSKCWHYNESVHIASPVEKSAGYESDIREIR
jgi:hypothetical protein